MLFKKGFLLYCDIWGKDCRGENYLEGHIRAVHEGMVPTVLFVLLFINYIRGEKSCWKQLQSESDFYDVTLVCDDRRIQAHKFIISSYSPII